MYSRDHTLSGLVSGTSIRHADRPAILAPSRRPLTYRRLADLTSRTGVRLRDSRLGRHARVAVVLPNGPDMAAAFVAVAAHCACAPLNPAFTRAEFEFYLTGVRADALIVSEETAGVAIEAAIALGLPVLRLRRLEAAGDFDLIGDIDPLSATDLGLDANPPAAEDTALLLHTSGTTSRPKLVPLSSANLVASAGHIATTLALDLDDRCLNVMPLFHIHGLAASILATLRAGGSVVCTDGVYANGFFDWLVEFRPTWYTAVPTMHQGIVARAGSRADAIRQAPLRFIRSSSAALAPSVLAALESAFSAPVVEAYGMTEAAHQMASNPLPPGRRKPGTVGLAAGPQVGIMNAGGELLGAGEIGEVVVRGANVIAGYDGNPEANAEAFHGGWFRTGDQGAIDEDGYVRLTGRLKELINRGGEKISPREVDEALVAHPSVRQAVTFAVPHFQLGEEVGAAIERRPGTELTEADVREWAGDRLAAFKVPRVIRFLDEIPKGPTGKLQRIGLSARLGIEPLDYRQRPAPHVPPRTEFEGRICAIWQELFPGVDVGVRTRFEALGGDSLLAARMLAAVGEACGIDVPYLVFAEDGTIETLARQIGDAAAEPSALLPLRREGTAPPLYCIPGHDGALHGLDRLARTLPAGRPVWSFDLRRLAPASSLGALAAQCLDALLASNPDPPYHFAGVCFGGLVATEMARLAMARGHAVAGLILIDSLNPSWRSRAPAADISRAWLAQLRVKAHHHRGQLRAMDMVAAAHYLARRGAAFLGRSRELLGAKFQSRALTSRHLRLAGSYRPEPVALPAFIVRVAGRRLDAPDLGWHGVFTEGITVVDVPFDVNGALSPARVDDVAALVASRLPLEAAPRRGRLATPGARL